MTTRPTALPSRRSQRGLTFISWLILLLGAGLIGLFLFRLIPVYLNHTKIVGALSSVKGEFASQSPTPAALRQALYKRFDIEEIGVLKPSEVKIERGAGEYVLVAAYDNEVPYLRNIYLVVKFDHRVSIPYGR